MRYRKLSPTGDYVFGHQQADFWINVPDAVAQAVETRLRMALGEWWLDTTDGTPWLQSVLQNNTQATRDPALQNRILGTTGLSGIDSYASQVVGRAFSVQATVDTIYGAATVEESF